LVLFPLAVAASGAAQVVQSWCIRNKRFRLTSAGQMVRSASIAVGQVALGCAGATHDGLVSGTVLGESLAAAVMSKSLRRSGRPGSAWWHTSRRRLAVVARRYKDFPLYATPQNVLNAISQGVPVLMLAQSFGSAPAGFYALAIRLMQAPMNLVLDPLRQVLFQKATEIHHTGGDLRKLHFRATMLLFAVGLIPAAILFLLCPTLFGWFLGEQWRPAGLYGRWLTVWLFITFCNPPSGLIARILRQQRNLLFFDTFTLAIRVGILWLGARWLSAPATVAAFSVAGAALNLGLIVWVAVLLRGGPRPGRAAQRPDEV
jgi:O-antigen/teichoic acid export membrane protein